MCPEQQPKEEEAENILWHDGESKLFKSGLEQRRNGGFGPYVLVGDREYLRV
jgi:hypothetical protein